MKHCELTITGKVQRIGFRFSAMQTAYKFNVKGFVKNVDGHVYIEAEGDDTSVQEFIDWCRRGPLGSRVDHVDVKENALRHYIAFDIL